jgi:hypothetical protein
MYSAPSEGSINPCRLAGQKVLPGLAYWQLTIRSEVEGECKNEKILLIKARGEPADARVRDDKEKLDGWSEDVGAEGKEGEGGDGKLRA